MPQILKLATLHCDEGTSDKVYGLAIVQDGTARSLVKFYGPRFRKPGIGLNVRTEHPVLINVEFSKKVAAEVAKGYKPIDWTNSYYGMVSTVRSIGTPPGEPDEQDKPVVFKKPVTRVQKPAAAPSLGRLSSAPRDFI